MTYAERMAKLTGPRRDELAALYDAVALEIDQAASHLLRAQVSQGLVAADCRVDLDHL